MVCFFFCLFSFSKFGYGFDGDAKNGDAMSEFVNVFLLISERALWTIMDKFCRILTRRVIFQMDWFFLCYTIFRNILKKIYIKKL